MRILQYAVRPIVILKYFGQLCIVLACLSLVPLGVSLLFGDLNVSGRYGVLILALMGMGVALFRIDRLRPMGRQRMQTNEAMVITAGIFIFSPLVLSWPMTASGIGYGDALFEAISGMTTTGLTTLGSVADKPPAFLFSRAWMQWVGGLGITVLSVAAMIQPGLAAKRLDIGEYFENDLVGSTRTNARGTFIVYAGLTAAGSLLLIVSGTGGFDALLYAFAAVSTGGFSPHDASLQGLGTWHAMAFVILFSMAGGVSLGLYRRAYRQGGRTFLRDRQLQAFLATALVTTLLLSCCLRYQDGFHWRAALGHGALNALSAQSTAGFSSTPVAPLGEGAKLSLILAMFMGGSMGSTAGGIKILRLLMILRLVTLLIQQAGSPPNAVSEARLSGRRLESDEVQGVLCILALFMGITFISWLAFVLLGHAPLDSLFEVVSAIGTAGLSTGITSDQLHPFLKGVLCADMLLGRLEIMVWLVVLYPGTWLGIRREQ